MALFMFKISKLGSFFILELPEMSDVVLLTPGSGSTINFMWANS